MLGALGPQHPTLANTRWQKHCSGHFRLDTVFVLIDANSYVIRSRIQIHHNSIGLLFNAEERFDRCGSAGTDMDWRPVVGAQSMPTATLLVSRSLRFPIKGER